MLFHQEECIKAGVKTEVKAEVKAEVKTEVKSAGTTKKESEETASSGDTHAQDAGLLTTYAHRESAFAWG